VVVTASQRGNDNYELSENVTQRIFIR